MLPRFVDPSLDRRVVEDRSVLDMPDHALRVDEEGLRQFEHRVFARDGAVEVEKRRKAVERERVHEPTDAGTVLEEIDRQEDRVGGTRDWKLPAAHVRRDGP